MLVFVTASAASSTVRPLHPVYRKHMRPRPSLKKGLRWPWRRAVKTPTER